jgi:type I restriction enzyme M protein
LNKYSDLLLRKSKLKKEIKDVELELDILAYNKYPKLSVKEIKTLVINNKWMRSIDESLYLELDRVSQTLT